MTVTKWLLSAILIFGMIVALAAANAYLESPWVQVVGRGALRTNAPAKLVREAQHAVVDRYRNLVPGPNNTRTDPTSSEASRTWSSGPSKDVVTTEIIRNRSQITDKNGQVLSIESIEASEAPTLVFVEIGAANGADLVITELVDELQRRGVVAR